MSNKLCREREFINNRFLEMPITTNFILFAIGSHTPPLVQRTPFQRNTSCRSGVSSFPSQRDSLGTCFWRESPPASGRYSMDVRFILKAASSSSAQNLLRTIGRNIHHFPPADSNYFFHSISLHNTQPVSLDYLQDE